MNDLNDTTSDDDLEDDFERYKDDYWRYRANQQFEAIEDGVLKAVDKWIAKGERKMTRCSDFLAAKDAQQAKRLAAEFLSGKEFAERLLPVLSSHLRNKHGAAIPSRAPQVVITIDSDEDESKNTTAPDSGASNSTTRRSHPQANVSCPQRGPP